MLYTTIHNILYQETKEYLLSFMLMGMACGVMLSLLSSKIGQNGIFQSTYIYLYIYVHVEESMLYRLSN